jgi:cytochrome c oxidase subunit 3/cytochrome o ubiquinol oxidase subunit 3
MMPDSEVPRPRDVKPNGDAAPTGPSGTGQNFPVPPAVSPEKTLSASQWGMVGFLVSEVAFFGTLIATYVAFIGKSKTGPTPAEALHLPLAIGTTFCLVSSSVVIHWAQRALEHGNQRRFCVCWAGTIALGIAFLAGTGYEWHELIEREHLTISRNLFGTTFYTLVGFHGLHVTAGVITMLVVLCLALGRKITEQNRSGVELVSWYWHFVDGVWIVVFLVVYV